MKEGELFVIQNERENRKNSMRINPFGARIEEVVLGGVPILVSVTRGDGKVGSTHPCTPIFGPEKTTSFGLSQHGAMRNSLCEVLTENNKGVTFRHMINEGTYPQGVRVDQRIELLDDAFHVTTFHWNKGKKRAPVNFAEHLYWATPKGWEGLKINGEDVTQQVKDDEVIPLIGLNTIEIPGQPKMILGINGFEVVNLWAYKDETGKYDTHYVCIEPVEKNPKTFPFGSEKTMKAAESVYVSSFFIRLAKS